VNTQTYRHFIGVDLGQASDFTAIAVLNRPLIDQHDARANRRPVYALRHLKRFPLGTHYSEVAQDLVEIIKQLNDPQLSILADQTGVGRAVVHQLIDGIQCGKPWKLHYITITAGTEMSIGDNGGRYVPKKELVGTLQVLLQSRRLQIPRSLPEATLLIRELEKFKAKPILATKDAPLDWREGQHDDMVLAVALAAWFGEASIPAYRPPEYDPYSEAQLRAVW
jgi:hypothetical protein